MKFWALSALALSSFGLSSVANADFVGIYGSVDYWNVQGDYNEVRHGRMMNDYNTLDWGDKGQAQLALSIEHPVPMLPNARLRHVTIETETDVQRVSGAPVYETSLNNTDFILYYEVLDNLVSVDVGLAAKRLDGDITYTSSLLERDTLKISETVPMVYGSAAAKLPFTGLSAKAELLATSYSDTKVSDLSAEIQYDFIDTLLVDVGARLGYRILDIELDDQQGLDTKFKFEGPYMGLEVHF